MANEASENGQVGTQNLWRCLSRGIVRIKHAARTVATPVGSPDAFAAGHRQVVEGFELNVGQDSSFQVAPQSLIRNSRTGFTSPPVIACPRVPDRTSWGRRLRDGRCPD